MILLVNSSGSIWFRLNGGYFADYNGLNFYGNIEKDNLDKLIMQIEEYTNMDSIVI